MSTNYTGVPTAVQSPASAPSVNVAPIIVIPADSDAFNAAALAQQFKVTVDHLAYLLLGGWHSKVLVFDQFGGSAVSTANWTVGGSLVNDAPNGGNGAVQFTSGQFIQSIQFALGTGNFRIRARVRNTGVVGTTGFSLGIWVSSTNKVSFTVDGASSTTSWRVTINGVSTAANGTAATIAATYKDFEMERSGNTVTFKVDGVVLHTASSYTDNLDGGLLTLTQTTSGTSFCDDVLLLKS